VQVLTAKRLAALERLLGGTKREAELETAWKNLLVVQPHDSQICGLLAEARQFLPTSLAASARMRESALASLVDRRTGRLWLKPGLRKGFFTGTIDGGDRESKGQWLLPAAPDDAPAVTAREDGFIGAIPYTYQPR
jgi:hypothetical protein